MSDRKDDFWKELMGEDFILPDEKPPKPKTAPAPQPAPKPAASIPGPTEPAPKPAQLPPKPTQPTAKPTEPVQPTPKPTPSAPPEPVRDTGFTIEYVSRETPAQPPKPAQPKPVQPAPPAPPKPAGPRPESVQPKPVQPARPAEPPRSEPVPPVDARWSRRKRDPEEDFEVNFDFDEEYPDVEEKIVRRGRTKRTGCMSGILMFVFVLCVSVVLASLGWMWAMDVLGLGGADQPVEVTLPKEIFSDEEREKENEDGEKETVTVNVADMNAVADELFNKGLIQYKWLFKLFSKFSTADEKVRAGTYVLNMNYDYRALVNGMTATGGVRQTTDVTIPEGYTITQIVRLLADNGVCGEDELLDTLANHNFDYDFLDSSTLGEPKRLEGYLFPDTYQFYVGDSPVNVITKLLNNFQRKWTEEFDGKAADLGYTPREVLIIASMIEKEAGADSERATIASVIYNRLENPDIQGTYGLLQIDATIYYVIADTGETFSTTIDSPYNTYMYEGLPIGPIANPGLASILAALEPESTNYYYYALGREGVHEFFTTFEGFTAFINSEDYGG